MIITFLGTRGFVDEYSRIHKNRSSLLIESDNKRLLVDFGDLYKPGQLPKCDYILITHAHPDHLFGLANIRLEIPIYLSTSTLRSEYYKKEDYEHLKIIKFKRRDSIKIGPFNIQLVPVLHATKAPNVALFIADKEHKICYASDVVSIRKADRDKYLKGCNVYIGDLSTHRGPKSPLIRKAKEDEGTLIGHTSPHTQLGWCRDANVHIAIFTHLGTEPIKLDKDNKLLNKLLPLENKYGVKIIIARDNDIYDIEELITMSERELLAKKEGLQLKPEDVAPITPKVFPKEPEFGLILKPPHGEWIWKGIKRAIVKTIKLKAHIGEPLYLVDATNKVVYGIIQLKEPVPISKEEFIKRYPEHRITEEERAKWAQVQPAWEHFPLYLYEFYFTKYEIPRPIRLKVRGPQIFIRAEHIEFLSIDKMSNIELEFYHSYFHTCSEIGNECCGYHYLLANEMAARGLVHLTRTVCDRVVELIVKPVKEYIKEIRETEDRPLGDDFRIVLAWYSSLRRGKKLKRKDGTPITIQDCKDMILAIVKEMIRRHHEYKKKGITKFTFNKPETYKPYARELFEWVIKQIGKENIPWKEDIKAKAIELVLPEGMTIEDIDPPYVIGLTDKELMELWEFLVNLANETATRPDEIPESIHNAGVFVGIELKKRDLWEQYEDKSILARAVALEVVEYPTPVGLELEEEFPEPEGDYIFLEDILNALPVHIPIRGEPYAVYVSGRPVNEGKVPKDHDIDFIFRQFPDPRVIVSFKSALPDWLSKRSHIVWDPEGPRVGYSVNVYRYGFFKLPEEDMLRGFGPFRYQELTKEVTIGKPLIMLKPKGGIGKYEFWTCDDAWKYVAKDLIDRGLFIQEKIDGRRMQLHLDKDKKLVKIITEDRLRDRSKVFPNIVKEILAKFNCRNGIFDGEMIAFEIPENRVIKSAKLKRKLDLMEREDTAFITVGKVTPEQEDKVVYVFYDVIYLDGKVVANRPYSERFKLLQKVIPKDARFIDLVRSMYATNLREFMKACKIMRTAPGSEGIVAKAADSIFPIKYEGENRTASWFKIKNLKEIDVMVWERLEKREKETGRPLGVYMYVSVFEVPKERVDEFAPNKIVEYKGKYYSIIGRSYATSVKAKRGDIITVMPVRIRQYTTKEGKIYYTWMFPWFKEKRPDKKEPDTITTVERIAALGTKPAPKTLAKFSIEELAEIVPEIVIKLPLCPFARNECICPLKRIFGRPRAHELHKLRIQYLKYPLVCPLANIYRCVYLKDYYYGYKEYPSNIEEYEEMSIEDQ